MCVMQPDFKIVLDFNDKWRGRVGEVGLLGPEMTAGLCCIPVKVRGRNFPVEIPSFRVSQVHDSRSK